MEKEVWKGCWGKEVGLEDTRVDMMEELEEGKLGGMEGCQLGVAREAVVKDGTRVW